jgi:hypothetical protein
MTDRILIRWADVRHHIGPGLNIYDDYGNTWRYLPGGGTAMLYRLGDILPADGWRPIANDSVWIDPPAVPEPPDGTRIEFEHHTDVYAARRDDDSSARAGYQVGDGGEVWCLFGNTVPRSWAVMWLEFGESLRTAVRLLPHPDDVGNYRQWPTAVMAAAEEAS